MLTTFRGIGLRFPHYQEILDKKPDIGWLEVHSENFFGEGRSLECLQEIRKHYPISLHGVGLSLGSINEPDFFHLQRLKTLIEKIEPFLISEHLSWSRLGKNYFPDLLPLPYTDESLQVLSTNIQKTQDFLKRSLLIENPSSYITYQNSTWEESDFLIALLEKTGAKLLLDVNNVFVSSMNHGWEPVAYIKRIPSHYVQEIHLAGHSTRQVENVELHIDTHDKAVCPEVWDLYRVAIQHCGIVPTLLEWDEAIPSLSELLAEAEKIKHYVE